MAQYTAIFTKPYEDGYENLPSQNTPITAETLNDKDDAIENIETYLSTNDIPSDAEGLSYDNTDSGLTADNVQSAIDEIVTDIPTTAEDIGYDNTDSGLTADNVQGAVDELADEKVDKTGVDVKTNTTGQFNTITGGLMQSCLVDLEPIQSGSGVPSPSNVRPISGHTQVQVGNCGKNILDYTYPTTTSIGITCTNNGDGTYTLNGTATSNATFILKDKASFSAIYEPHKSSEMKLLGCPSGGGNSTYKLQIWRNNGGLADAGSGVTVPSNALGSSTDWNLAIVVYSGQVLNNLVFKPMLTKDLSATYSTFEPYNGYTKVINLGGTYYGGTLDAVSGVLTLDRKFKELNGTEAWNASGTNGFAITRTNAGINDVLVAGTKQTPMDSNMFPNSSNVNVWTDGYIGIDNGTIWIGDTNLAQFTDLATFKTFLSNNHLQIVYPLATPITIQLTPTQLETLVGQNDVFAPLVGQTLDNLTYREVLAWDDVEKAVNVKLDLSSVAPIEYTDKASQSYNQKQLFIKDNKLCQALASISSGASFTENTNFKYTTLAEIIEPLIP